jgi:hypothetical protein
MRRLPASLFISKRAKHGVAGSDRWRDVANKARLEEINATA